MVPEEASFKDKNGIYMTRRQFPLSLGYAITVHRSQCMTYNKLIVDLTGKNWKPGMFYTILSRTRKLSDIIILAYDRKSFKVISFFLSDSFRIYCSNRYLKLHWMKCFVLKKLKKIIR
jgi:ATP-dependent exoDNAse (exonuclease V) alpha subunit